MAPPQYEVDLAVHSSSSLYADEETELMAIKKLASLESQPDSPPPQTHSTVRPRSYVFELSRSLPIAALIGIILFKLCQYLRPPQEHTVLPDISVAFIGNSMIYFNDLPRFLEVLSEHHLTQNSCLHGDASLTRILETGNGMYGKFNTTNALNSDGVYDFGACTVRQLLLGHDAGLERDVWNGANSSLHDDGTNPCLQDHSYLHYLDDHVFQQRPHYDFILINDNTRNPGRMSTRAAGLRILEDVYVPWITQTGATPVFFDTHAYTTSQRNMSGFEDIPTFTSLTYEGYKQYQELLTRQLPPGQAPRLAPVGLAFLTVWEENRRLWHKMFNIADSLHSSPLGTLLTGCVIFYSLYGRMPDKEVVFKSHDLSLLWSHARVMQQADEPPNPFPNVEEAHFLYDVADRVARLGHIPRSFITYENGEAAPGLKL